VFSSSQLRRRVSVEHKGHGSLAITIALHNNWTTYVIMLVAFTAGFIVMGYLFVSPFFRQPLGTDSLYLFLPIAFIVVSYLIGIRVSVWRAFGVEQLVIEKGAFRWTRTAIYWVRRVEMHAKDITAIKAVTPWHALSNRVEFTALGRRQTIGDMLLHDETTELAEHLRRALDLS